MEMFDVVDEYGNPTGKTIERTYAHEKGIRHRTVHIWVIKKEEGKIKILLQKRAKGKDSFPERYDTSSAGHVQAGDEVKESALRELKEELGIDAEEKDLIPAGKFIIQYQKEFYNKMFIDNEIAFVFVYDKHVDISSLTLQKEEVECVEWFDLNETYNECEKHNKKFCVPLDGLKLLKDFMENTYNK